MVLKSMYHFIQRSSKPRGKQMTGHYGNYLTHRICRVCRATDPLESGLEKVVHTVQKVIAPYRKSPKQ